VPSVRPNKMAGSAVFNFLCGVSGQWPPRQQT
jgi:hypothetical protein